VGERYGIVEGGVIQSLRAAGSPGRWTHGAPSSRRGELADQWPLLEWGRRRESATGDDVAAVAHFATHERPGVSEKVVKAREAERW